MNTGSCRIPAVPDGADHVIFGCYPGAWSVGTPAWTYDSGTSTRVLVGVVAEDNNNCGSTVSGTCLSLVPADTPDAIGGFLAGPDNSPAAGVAGG